MRTLSTSLLTYKNLHQDRERPVLVEVLCVEDSALFSRHIPSALREVATYLRF